MAKPGAPVTLRPKASPIEAGTTCRSGQWKVISEVGTWIQPDTVPGAGIRSIACRAQKTPTSSPATAADPAGAAGSARAGAASSQRGRANRSIRNLRRPDCSPR
ncbi:hypothetical protein MASR1M32_08840 [Rhodobacter sp.]